MADVFISYVREERFLTEQLAHDLEQAGFSVWWDVNLLPHQQFRAEIDAQLDACTVAIILWTPRAIRSEWIIAEADHAYRQKKLVNTHANELNPNLIPKPFNQIHSVGLLQRGRIIAAVKSMIAGKSANASSEPLNIRIGSRRVAFPNGGYAKVAAIGVAILSVIALGFAATRRHQDALTTGPQWTMTRTEFIGQPVSLQWTYDPGSSSNHRAVDAPVNYEVQSSSDAGFKADATKVYDLTDGPFKKVPLINGQAYWRVRAVEQGSHVPVSEWSTTKQISQYESAYRRVRSTQKLRVAVSSSEDEDVFKWMVKRNYHGYDINLAREITKALLNTAPDEISRNPIFIPVSWSDIFKSLGEGRADISIATISKTEEREQAQKIRFSESYYCTNQSLLFANGTAALRVHEMLAGKSVGFTAGTTSERLLAALKQNVNFQTRPYVRSDLMTNAILGGEIDLGVTDTPFAMAQQATARSGAKELLAYKPLTADDFSDRVPASWLHEEYAIAVRADDPLLQTINEILTRLKRNGTLTELFASAQSEFEQAKELPAGTLRAGAAAGAVWECPTKTEVVSQVDPPNVVQQEAIGADSTVAPDKSTPVDTSLGSHGRWKGVAISNSNEVYFAEGNTEAEAVNTALQKCGAAGNVCRATPDKSIAVQSKWWLVVAICSGKKFAGGSQWNSDAALENARIKAPARQQDSCYLSDEIKSAKRPVYDVRQGQGDIVIPRARPR